MKMAETERYTNDIEFRDTNEGEEQGNAVFTDYPRADGGREAWLFLAGCCTFEALIWGFAFTFGLFQEYYSTYPPFAGSSNIAVVGTTQSGIMYMGLAPCIGVLLAYPSVRKFTTFTGLGIMCAGLIGASFANTTTQLLFTQGILYGIGGCLTYAPTIILLNEWFILKKGLAFGIVIAGLGVAGITLPFLIDWALTNFGFRTVLRAYAVILFVITAPLLAYVKPRLPYIQSRRSRLSFLKSRDFFFVQLGNLLEALGFFLPQIYLPTFARTIGGGSLEATMTLVCFNVSQIFGCVAMGMMVDRYHVVVPFLVSTIGTVIGVFVIWGLATTLPLLYVFCITYGFFAGGFSSIWPGVTNHVSATVASADSAMVFAILAAGKGVGSVLSGPLSEALLRGNTWISKSMLGYGTGYGPIILATGISALLGGVSMLGRFKPATLSN